MHAFLLSALTSQKSTPDRLVLMKFSNNFTRVRCDHGKHEPIWAGAR